MSKYQPRISKTSDGDFYALVVNIHKDGHEQVMRGFRGHYKSEKMALKQANKFIAKCEAGV